jgi:hypothetical protein
MRLVRPLVFACALAIVLVPAAAGADRMWVGFQDDPVLRYDEDRQAGMDLASRTNNARILRTIVVWSQVAPERPANAANPFDPAYQFDDLDEFVRNAQARDMEVLMSIWGTPSWANGGKKPQYLPTKMADFQNFARALSSRYSGRYAGFPFVRFYGIWNESNLGLFLLPQFNAKGAIVSPAAYAKLAAAGYAGIGKGSPKALVAIGETSSTGRDKKSKGTDAVAPATFMKGIAKANKKLKFDAWAQHPYPLPVNQKPTQKVRYPNVTLTSLPQFEKDLDAAFGRKNIPIWVTEYGNETKPGNPRGVTEAQQAVYLPQAIGLAKKDPRVAMFVWFVMRDSTGSPWHSGIYRESGAPKRARPKYASTAKPLDATNGKVTVKGGSKNPALTVYLRSFCVNNPIGTTVGTNVRVTKGGKLAGVSQPSASLAIDCTISVRAPVTVAKGSTYVVQVDANSAVGNAAARTITLVGK